MLSLNDELTQLDNSAQKLERKATEKLQLLVNDNE
jgi:hypothetical protein